MVPECGKKIPPNVQTPEQHQETQRPAFEAVQNLASKAGSCSMQAIPPPHRAAGDAEQPGR